jgi:hypothetical protein
LIALLAVLGQRQAKQLGAGWRGSAALVGYLRPEVPAERADEMTRAIAALPGVLRVELVGPDETARRLSEGARGPGPRSWPTSSPARCQRRSRSSSRPAGATC